MVGRCAYICAWSFAASRCGDKSLTSPMQMSVKPIMQRDMDMEAVWQSIAVTQQVSLGMLS